MIQTNGREHCSNYTEKNEWRGRFKSWPELEDDGVADKALKASSVRLQTHAPLLKNNETGIYNKKKLNIRASLPVSLDVFSLVTEIRAITAMCKDSYED